MGRGQPLPFFTKKMLKLSDKEQRFFPFFPNPGCNYRKKYPELMAIPEIANFEDKLEDGRQIDFDRIFTYIILYYTKGTPLMRITDHNDRKLAAAEYCGFQLQTKKYMDAVMAKDKGVNKIIIAYLRLQRSFAWSKLCGFIDSFYHQLAKLQGGETDKDKTKDILANISTTEEEIEKTMDQFINYDPNKLLSVAVLSAVDEESVMKLRPEALIEEDEGDTGDDT